MNIFFDQINSNLMNTMKSTDKEELMVNFFTIYDKLRIVYNCLDLFEETDQKIIQLTKDSIYYLLDNKNVSFSFYQLNNFVGKLTRIDAKKLMMNVKIIQEYLNENDLIPYDLLLLYTNINFSIFSKPINIHYIIPAFNNFIELLQKSDSSFYQDYKFTKSILTCVTSIINNLLNIIFINSKKEKTYIYLDKLIEEIKTFNTKYSKKITIPFHFQLFHYDKETLFSNFQFRQCLFYNSIIIESDGLINNDLLIDLISIFIKYSKAEEMKIKCEYIMNNNKISTFDNSNYDNKYIHQVFKENINIPYRERNNKFSKEFDEEKQQNIHENIKEKLLDSSVQNKKYIKKKIPLTLKLLVWKKYVGIEYGITKCFCCKLQNIFQASFHCGHVIPEFYGGKLSIDNLRPICQSCNSSMRTRNMNEFIKSFSNNENLEN